MRGNKVFVQSNTVIRFVTTNAEFGICTVVGLNGQLLIKFEHSRVNVNILSSTSLPSRPATVQIPNLELSAVNYGVSEHRLLQNIGKTCFRDTVIILPKKFRGICKVDIR